MIRLWRYWRQSRAIKAANRANVYDRKFQDVLSEIRNLHPLETYPINESADFVANAISSEAKLCKLGNLIYENSEGIPKRMEWAMYLWKLAMQKGSDPARYNYAKNLMKQKGTDNRKEAIQHFEILTGNGHLHGTMANADALLKGDGTIKNEEKAFELLQHCANQGLHAAYTKVATLYATGIGTAKDISKAIVWYEKGAEVGDPKAHACLGDLYSMNPDVKDIKKAIHHYEEAAVRSEVSAQYNYAVLLMSRNEVSPNYRLAETLFYKAARSGHVLAMVNLAQMYIKGYKGVPKNVDAAAQWLKIAANYNEDAQELLRDLQKRTEMNHGN